MQKRLLLLAITVISWGLFALINKILLQRMHLLQILICGCFLNLALLPIYYYSLRSSNVSQTPNIWTIALCILGGLLSVIGGAAYIYNIKLGEVGTIAVLSCAYPIITVILAALFLGEPLTVSKIIGIMLVMSGVFILAR